MTIPLGQRQLPRQWPTGKGNRAKTPQGRAQDRAQVVTPPPPTERNKAGNKSVSPATRRGRGRRHGRPNGRQGAHTRGRRPPHSALIGRAGAQHERPGQNPRPPRQGRPTTRALCPRDVASESTIPSGVWLLPAIPGQQQCLSPTMSLLASWGVPRMELGGGREVLQDTPGGDPQRLSTTSLSMWRNLWRPCGG